ncbi:MAG: DUF349 domain-containing protein [Bacteroidales bacterium]|nr:DUF349 domain-containing protein [Candidatus Cacconaster merdequi]
MSENPNPIVPETEVAVETQQTNEEQSVEQVNYSEKGLKELVDSLASALENDTMQELYKHAEMIKAAFYKTLRKEKVAAGGDASASTEVASDAESGEEGGKTNPFEEVEQAFKDLFAKYKEKKALYTQEIEKMKEENFTVKSAILEDLKALVDKKDDLGQAFPQFRDIQSRWKAAGPVPQAKSKELYDTYQHYVEMFYDYVKINKEFRDLDFKKNLEVKEELCRKAEELDKEENVVEAFRTLQKLHEQWKELGPVSKEFRESIWDRFKAATAVINKKHQAFFEEQKGNLKENLEAKTALCEKVEEIAAKEVKDSNMWNTLSKEIENIQKEWRTIGMTAKKDNQKIYDRFRAACDEFFAKKRDFYSEFKGQMQDNMAKKIAICEKAEALKDSTDWKATSEALVELQKEWKEIGPVSRKKSEQIWKRFRAACDEFFNNRDKNGGSKGSEYAANLERKLSIIDEIKEFAAESKEDAQEAYKAFLQRWNEIGFVPFKEKAKVQDSFREALNEKFSDLREYVNKGARNVRHKVETERDKLVQKFVKKEQEIATWENNLGFFAKSKNAELLLKDLYKKIDEAKEELADLEAKIKEMDRQNEQE